MMRALVRSTPSQPPAPISVRVAGSGIVLSGPLAGRLGREPELSNFVNRCRGLNRLKRLQFDLAAARIELRFGSPALAGEGLRSLARLMQETGTLERPGASPSHQHIALRVWQEPVTLWRSGGVLSTWRLQHLGGERVRLVHPLLRDPSAVAIIADYLDRRGAVVAIEKRAVQRGFLDVVCDSSDPQCLTRLVAEAEAIEAVLRKRVPVPFTSPEGSATLLNANLAASIGTVFFPPLLPVSAVTLAVASWPVARDAWQLLRQGKADVTTVLSILSALALINGDHLPAALMLWLFRAWDVLTRRTLRRSEVQLFERLAATAGGESRALRGAAEAALTVFAEAPRYRAAKAFADSATPLMLCVGASALFAGGTPLAQATLRPDFFSSVLVHRRIAAAELVLRLAERGIVVRDFRALIEIREADEVLLDDGVDWHHGNLAPGEFGRRMADTGVRETVLFRSAHEDAPSGLAAKMGATRYFIRSAVHTPAAYLTQQRFLGHRVIHVRAVHGVDTEAHADVPVAIGPGFLGDTAGAPIGLAEPSLERLCEIVELIRSTKDEESAVKSMTIALNTVLIGGAVYAGVSTLGVVVAGTVATTGLWAGLQGRFARRTKRLAAPA